MSLDGYSTTAQESYASRCREFLEFSVERDTGQGREAIVSQIARLELGRGPINEAIIRDALAFVDARHDCSDFVVASLLRILYQYADSPLLPSDLVASIRQTVLGFKYWITDPGYDMMCFWSENHQLGFYSCEYLAGQLYPDAVFANTSQSGRWHMERAQPKVMGWLDAKARFGFSEWDSNNYHRINVLNLVNLADFPRELDVALKSSMMLDLLMFDMAVDSFRGAFGCSHGRTYPHSIVTARREGTSPLQRIAWGLGGWNDPYNGAALAMATSRRYRVAPVIEALAQDLPDELVNLERQGLQFDEAARYGLDVDDPDDAMLLWSAGKFSPWNIAKTLAWADSSFSSHRYHVVIRPYAAALLGTYEALEAQGTPCEIDLERTALLPVNKYSYRTPDYQLAAAQDYRKGLPGYQQHIWQATLGPDAIAFTLHRGSASDASYKYWVGRFPRAAQYKNVLIALYDIPEQPFPGPKTIFPPEAGGNDMPSEAPSEEELLPRTVAVLRRSAFDQVIERSGWVLARKGHGYLALRSQQPTRWTSDGVLQGEGLIAEGRRNAWICQMGREAVDGPFTAWADRITSAPVEFGDLAVRYQAPGVGEVHLAWDGPFTVNGCEISLGDYPRFDNPYCQAGYGSTRYDITFQGRCLTLDFAAIERRERQVAGG